MHFFSHLINIFLLFVRLFFGLNRNKSELIQRPHSHKMTNNFFGKLIECSTNLIFLFLSLSYAKHSTKLEGILSSLFYLTTYTIDTAIVLASSNSCWKRGIYLVHSKDEIYIIVFNFFTGCVMS